MLFICSEAFEKIVFDAIFEFMAENNLLTNTHAGLKSTDFCVNQLTSTTHGIFSGFDTNPSLVVLGVFIELSKAFVRV